MLFDEDTPISLLEALRPDILVKGNDYRIEQVVGKEVVEAYGGRVELVPILEGHTALRPLPTRLSTKQNKKVCNDATTRGKHTVLGL